MLARAEGFLTRFPQSAFLAQAYEVAARASFDLQKYEAGLAYARQSLTLLPENPLLLVPVADVESQQKLNETAVAHAEEALLDLRNFAGPSSVTEQDWPSVKRKLEASAHFSKSRALLQEALDLPSGDGRAYLLRTAESALTAAGELNPADSEITYTLGLVQLTSGKGNEAASSFAAVYRAGGEAAPRAEKNLRAIYKLLHPRSDIPFETFVQVAADRSQLRQKDSPAESRTPSDPSAASRSDAAYYGSNACRGCHAQIYRQWADSGMAKMLRPYAPENVLGDFTNNNEFYLGDEIDYQGGTIRVTRGRQRTLFARMTIRDKRHYFEMHQSDGQWHSYPVDYTIGSKFEQAYATRLQNGEIHVFPIQYNLQLKQWVNFWKVIDSAGSERSDPRNWEKLDGSTSYQAICAVCHTSQLRNLQGGGFDVNHVEFKEPGIDCEMCHGPSGNHVMEATTGDFYRKSPETPPINFEGIDNRKFVAICAQCHMQSAIRTVGSGGELNYAADGEFFGHPMREPFGEFSRKGFYKDGRFRQTTFMVEALERSQCFKKGAVSCGTCHDPHRHGPADNPTSLKLRDQSDQMCTGCHTQLQDKSRVAQHTHHAPESEGSRCVSCHMPRIMDALLFRARYHQIDDIPNAAMTKRFGEEESPNACLLCHSKNDANWVEKQLSNWKSIVARRQ
jgi:predicted CXXCH cytochrome family protein